MLIISLEKVRKKSRIRFLMLKKQFQAFFKKYKYTYIIAKDFFDISLQKLKNALWSTGLEY